MEEFVATVAPAVPPTPRRRESLPACGFSADAAIAGRDLTGPSTAVRGALVSGLAKLSAQLGHETVGAVNAANVIYLDPHRKAS